MISAGQIQEILSLYTKYGWKLKQVLLTAKLQKHLADSIENLFDSAEIIDSNIDAVWFSRPSGKDKEAWELRRLSETPYALFESFASEDNEQFRQEVRREMEAKIKQSISGH